MLKRDRGVIDSSENSAAKRAIILSSIGEVVAWFDFTVYLSLAPVLAKVIFAPDDSSSLLMTLGIFGRPSWRDGLTPSCSVIWGIVSDVSGPW
jgi:MFS family permease